MTFTTSSSSSDRFQQAFTETVDQYRIVPGEDPTDAPMPDPVAVEHATDMLVRTIFDVLHDTRLESIADRIAWGVVHSLHKVTEQIEGQGDKAAMGVKSLIRQADGSEVGSRELEEAQQLCQSLDETRDALACMRDHAAATYLAETGKPWSAPRASLTSSKRTASVVAATDFLAARRKRKIDAHAPQGPVVIFSGGQVWEDYQLLYDRLDAIRARVPNMILATSAQDRGCDAIAAAWAAQSGCKLVTFGINRRLGNRAGFVRNEQLLRLRPVEAIVCEGSGLQSHLAREVRKQGIPAHFFRLADQNAGREAAPAS